ncbi:MAG: ATP-binding cassette domain-containing protein [Candidatus Pacebacteria bacterium]|nr:ATP-binding cassette domain-containing protein [Candidatus Paceibacterota bacterium]
MSTSHSAIAPSGPAAAGPASSALVPVSDKQIVSGQEVVMIWENISFSAPAKTPAVSKPKEPTADILPQTTERLETVPNPADKAVHEGMAEPPESIDGKPMHNVVWNLTGMVRPREFVGMLGPSGAGKTVLMNILSDRLNTQPGSLYQRNVYLNNKVPLTRELFGKLCTYVMQDDVLMETMTPFECLSFSANLRLSCSQKEKDKHVIETISLLKLQNCMNTLVSS